MIFVQYGDDGSIRRRKYIPRGYNACFGIAARFKPLSSLNWVMLPVNGIRIFVRDEPSNIHESII